jgi:hypothetical protein
VSPSPGSFAPSTRKALAKALRDPSPPVRAQAALAIGQAGGSRAPAGRAKPPADRLEVRPPLQKALQEAFNAPAAAAPPRLPSSAEPLAAPKDLANRAFNQMLFEGMPVKPEVKDELWKKAQKDPAPEERVDAVSKIAREYLAHTKAGSSTQALQELQERLAANPELFHKVLAQIDRELVDFCEECRENNTIR